MEMIEFQPERSTSPQISESSSSTENKRPASVRLDSLSSRSGGKWIPSCAWVSSWKSKLPLQTIMRLLQVLVPQVEKICIDK